MFMFCRVSVAQNCSPVLLPFHVLAKSLPTEAALISSPMSKYFEKAGSKGHWLVRQSTVTGKRLQALAGKCGLAICQRDMPYKMLDPPVPRTGELQRSYMDRVVTGQMTGAVGSYNATLDILFSFKRLFSCPKIKDKGNKVLK